MFQRDKKKITQETEIGVNNISKEKILGDKIKNCTVNHPNVID